MDILTDPTGMLFSYRSEPSTSNQSTGHIPYYFMTGLFNHVYIYIILQPCALPSLLLMTCLSFLLYLKTLERIIPPLQRRMHFGENEDFDETATRQVIHVLYARIYVSFCFICIILEITTPHDNLCTI